MTLMCECPRCCALQPAAEKMVVMQQSNGSSPSIPSTHGPVFPGSFTFSARPGYGVAARKKLYVPVAASPPTGRGITSSERRAASLSSSPVVGSLSG
eukprot:scaffold37249_cov236-Isochrysis_galbana.AAC.1